MFNHRDVEFPSSTRSRLCAAQALGWLGALLGALGCGNTAPDPGSDAGPVCDNGVTAPGQGSCGGRCAAGQVCNGGVCGAPTAAVAYQINAAHTGGQAQESLAPPLCQRWSVDLDGPVSYPLIADGRVFVTVGDKYAYGSKLHALDLQTGKDVWKPIELGGTYYWSNAAYDAGRVFAVNFDGAVRAFNSLTGEKLWEKVLPVQAIQYAPPTAAGGYVYIAGAPPGTAGGIFVLNASDGSIAWESSLNNGDDGAPVVSDNIVYIAGACSEIWALKPGGEALWTHPNTCTGGGGRTAALVDGKLYCPEATDKNLIVDAQTGSDLGTFAADVIPAFDGSRGFFVSGGKLEARDLSTLSIAWTFAGESAIVLPPIAVHGHVYVETFAGVVHAIDEQTGKDVWSTNVGQRNTDEIGPTAGLAAAAGALVIPMGTRLAAYW